VVRDWYDITDYALDGHGRCRACDTHLPGVYDGAAGGDGAGCRCVSQRHARESRPPADGRGPVLPGRSLRAGCHRRRVAGHGGPAAHRPPAGRADRAARRLPVLRAHRRIGVRAAHAVVGGHPPRGDPGPVTLRRLRRRGTSSCYRPAYPARGRAGRAAARDVPPRPAARARALDRGAATVPANASSRLSGPAARSPWGTLARTASPTCWTGCPPPTPSSYAAPTCRTTSPTRPHTHTIGVPPPRSSIVTRTASAHATPAAGSGCAACWCGHAGTTS
jgi:hypothetical protein